MKIKQTIKLIIIGIIIFVSLIPIPANLILMLGNPYVNINTSNKNIIFELIPEASENLIKIEYVPGLGDWTLNLYYEDGSKDNIMFNEDARLDIVKYMQKNKDNSNQVIPLLISIIIISICLLCVKKFIIDNNLK